MSRCFPYPPPDYSRNGATYEALIESIKLQKETDKAKAERKKEKRAKKEKKKEKKERRKDEDKAKAQKNPIESQPNTHKVLRSPVNTKRQVSTEQLEKSDVTEEHGQPISSQKPSYSSDSTQNSNKRKREHDAILPGKPIKIRLLKKQGPDSTNSGRTDPQSLCGADTRVNTWKISTDPSVPSASNSVHGFHPESRAPLVSSNRKTGTAQGVLLSQQKATPTSLARPGKNNNDVQGLHLNRNEVAASSGRPILPSNSNKTEVPAPSVSKNSGQKHLTPSFGAPILPSLNSNRTVQGLFSATPSHLKNEIPKPSSNVGPSRTDKKRQKKHNKYEKLMGSWVPPVFQAYLSGANDEEEDWLSGSGKTSIRLSGDDVGRCRELAASSLGQPCAQFLPEADLYALPYTVPF